MKRTVDAYHRDVISGRERGIAAAMSRAVLRLAEVPFAGITSLRNALYAWGASPAHAVDCPVVCVGNITTGGTGKTPIVRWLSEHLVQRHIRSAILLRGYKSRGDDQPGDEQQLLRRLLDPAIPIRATRIASPAVQSVHRNRTST